LFGKVYFPRLTIAISNSISATFQFFIQFFIFIIFYIYFLFNGVDLKMNFYLFIFIIFIILYVSFLSFSFGMIFSALTAKYRDLIFLLSFGIQVWMFVSPVVYPISALSENYQLIISFNPMTFPIEFFRMIVFDNSDFNLFIMINSFFVSLIIFIIGIFLFHRTEKKFIDTV